MAAYACVEVVVAVLFLVFGTFRALLNDVIFAAVVVIAAVVTYVFWRLSDRGVTVRLSSTGVEQHFSRHTSTCTPWHDIESVAVASWTLKSTEVQCPVLVLKNGQKVRINAILTPVRPISPVTALFRSVPRDPRFEEKISDLRRLLAQSRNAQRPGAMNPGP